MFDRSPAHVLDRRFHVHHGHVIRPADDLADDAAHGSVGTAESTRAGVIDAATDQHRHPVRGFKSILINDLRHGLGQHETARA